MPACSGWLATQARSVSSGVAPTGFSRTIQFFIAPLYLKKRGPGTSYQDPVAGPPASGGVLRDPKARKSSVREAAPPVLDLLLGQVRIASHELFQGDGPPFEEPDHHGLATRHPVAA